MSMNLSICVESDYNTNACRFYTKTCLSGHTSQQQLIINIFVTMSVELMHCTLLKRHLSSSVM